MSSEPYLGVLGRLDRVRIPLPRWRLAKDGRWRVRIACPDGVMRSLVATRRAPRPLESVESPVDRPGVGARLRWDILARDGFRCRYCGRGAPDVELEVDHLLSIADGGTGDPSNLGTACWECNIGKGERSVVVSVVVSDRDFDLLMGRTRA